MGQPILYHEAPIHERDLAAVGARALLSDDLVGRRGRRLQLTGPHSLTHAEMVAIIGDVIGRPLRYQEIAPEAAKQGMIAQGSPEPFVTALMARYAREIAYAAPVTGEVERILGRAARTYAEWVAEHADAFQTEQAGQAATDDAHGRRGDRSSHHTYKGADR